MESHELTGLERRRTLVQTIDVPAPGLLGILGVEAEDGAEDLPQGIQVFRAQEALRHPSRRRRDKCPVDLAAPGHRVQRSGQRHVVLPRSRGIDVVQQLRVGVAPQDDVGPAALEALLDVAIPPPRGEPERLFIGVHQP